MNSTDAPISKPLNAPRFLIIGAGSRGNAYARAVTTVTSGVIAAVAEPDKLKRNVLGCKYIWGPAGQSRDDQAFESWQTWLKWEKARRKSAASSSADSVQVKGVDGVFIVSTFILASLFAALMPVSAPLTRLMPQSSRLSHHSISM